MKSDIKHCINLKVFLLIFQSHKEKKCKNVLENIIINRLAKYFRSIIYLFVLLLKLKF